jgi:hypothetical protein
MRKLLSLTILSLSLLLFVKSVALADPPTATPTVDQSLIQQLGNEIASKTAQLNLVEKRGIIGTVSDVSSTQITLTDVNGNTRFVDVDELTKFSSSTSPTFGISDVNKGDILGVLGLYNRQTRRILARVIETETAFPTIVIGEVSNIDKTNYEVTVTKEDGGKTVVEIEDVTQTYTYSAGTATKSGFSKMLTGQTVSVMGYPDKQDTSKIMASQIYILSDIQLNYNLNANLPTMAPSTGSGIKLYPIKQ